MSGIETPDLLSLPRVPNPCPVSRQRPLSAEDQSGSCARWFSPLLWLCNVLVDLLGRLFCRTRMEQAADGLCQPMLWVPNVCFGFATRDKKGTVG